MPAPQRTSGQPPTRPAPNTFRPAPQGYSNSTIYVKKSGGIGWGLIVFLLLITGGVGYAIYAKISYDKALKIANEQHVTGSIYSLPEIAPDPEKEEILPPLDTPVFDEGDFHFLPDKEPDIPEPPKPAGGNPTGTPKKPNEIPKNLVRKEISHTTPGVAGIPEDRVVDVLCVYTSQYKVRYGRDSATELLKRVSGFFEESNKKYQSQGTNTAVRLIGLVEIDYYDSYMVNDLNHLSRGKIYTYGGVSTHDLRSQFGADMIALLGTKGGGGVSNGNAFFIVKRGGGIFTHECQHAYGWGHGEQLPDGKGDDVSKLGRNAPGRSSWMPSKVKSNTVYVEYLNTGKN
ncbi:MAG: zinc-dependent metalloprotease [Puniceicoccales bacterium]|nr:zinc-dependent metalloprotease [Puniceicoccales bacterium]